MTKHASDPESIAQRVSSAFLNTTILLGLVGAVVIVADAWLTPIFRVAYP